MKMAFKINLLPYSKLFYISLRSPKRKSEVQSASSKIRYYFESKYLVRFKVLLTHRFIIYFRKNGFISK